VKVTVGAAGGPAPFTAGEAFAAVLYGAVASDGTVSQGEAIALTRTLFGTSMFRGLGERQMRAVLARVREVHAARGLASLLAEAAPRVPADLRDTAYAHCVGLVMADGEVDEQELDYLRKAQKALHVSDEVALKVVEVARILHMA
jgi:uncharacterized tellurite resistance protein B-like protein